jgi:hypothetical protein
VIFFTRAQLCTSNWTFIGKRVWSTTTFYIAPTEDGLHADHNEAVIFGRRGLVIALGQHLVPFITLVHTTPCNKAVFVHLDGLPGRPIGLLNVYGPNEAHLQSSF